MCKARLLFLRAPVNTLPGKRCKPHNNGNLFRRTARVHVPGLCASALGGPEPTRPSSRASLSFSSSDRVFPLLVHFRPVPAGRLAILVQPMYTRDLESKG